MFLLQLYTLIKPNRIERMEIMKQDENNFSVRTDLAVEAKDMYIKQQEKPKEIQGIITKERTEAGIQVSHVQIDEAGGKEIGKKPGNYITIYADGVKNEDTKSQANAAKILAAELEQLIRDNDIPDDGKALIVGLGNWNVTPDALGPMTVEKVMVTNHLFELNMETVSEGYRPVSAVSPGVMGVTGMETSNIIHGIVEKFQPDFIIAVDALASRSIERINETIQISDSGIHPGSGVGNKRKELSKATLGVPVIAIGVPTVVDAVTITSDTIDYMLKHLGKEWSDKDRPANALSPGGFTFGKTKLTEEHMPDTEKRQAFLGMIGTLSEEDKRALIKEVLTPTGHNMMVTPKEVDGFMIDMSHLLANGINASLHETVDVDNLAFYSR